MPEFIAVQCFQCNQYQVSQKRKDSKFNCKLCNAKQSVKKVFAHSDRASDVRKFIQPLNLARGRAEEKYDQENPHEQGGERDGDESSPGLSDGFSRSREPLLSVAQSRWQPYSVPLAKRFRSPDLDDTDEFGEANDDIITTLPDMQGKGRRRKRQRMSRKQQGQLENGNQSLKVGAGYTTTNKNTNDEPTRNEDHRGYQWGAGPSRKTSATPTPKASSPDTFGGSSGASYAWGSGRSRFPQSQPRSKPASDSRGSRWGTLARHGPQNFARKTSQVSSTVTPSFDTDGLVTTFGSDEVVQDEVLY